MLEEIVGKKEAENIQKGLLAVVGFMTGALISGGMSYWFVKLSKVWVAGDWVGVLLVMLLPVYGFFSAPNILGTMNLVQQKQNKKQELSNEIRQRIDSIKTKMNK